METSAFITFVAGGGTEVAIGAFSSAFGTEAQISMLIG